MDVIQIEIEIADIPGLPNNVLYVELKKEDLKCHFEETMDALKQQILQYGQEHMKKDLPAEDKITSNMLLDRLARQFTMHLATRFHCDSRSNREEIHNKYAFQDYNNL